MEEENKKENGCKIFSILFKNKESEYEFGKVLGMAEINLQKIAQLGGTQHYYTTENLSGLINAFKRINEAIKNNFGLKLNKE